MYWDLNLPFAVEAFAFSERPEEQGRSAARAMMKRTHRSFLAYYGLTEEEVPLLQYVCSELDYARDKSMAGTPQCFIEVS